jgi:alkylated DNA nucleotide flippase Atl1
MPAKNSPDPSTERIVGRIRATTHDNLSWRRVVRSDRTISHGKAAARPLIREGVPMRGDRLDLRHARVPAGITIP